MGAAHLIEARAALAPKMQEVQAEYVEGRVDELVERDDITPEQARRSIETALQGRLLNRDFPILTRAGWIVVGDILDDPKKWHGQNCWDPIEAEAYGSITTAIIYADQHQPVIRSFAHQGGDTAAVYRLETPTRTTFCSLNY